ncbi:MAG: peptidase [Anaerospora sp.]|nr:peptidase [Anaerospora sp.]
MSTNRLKAPVTSIDEQALVLLCQQLIQTPSYTGQEKGVASLLKDTMLGLGFDRVWIDAVGNVIGEIKGALPGPRILFDGHIDTVEVSDEDKWSVAPFAGELRDGHLYGRGATDMKCAIGAMVQGLAPLIAVKNTLAGSIFISGTVCEETFEGIALGTVIEAVQPDCVVIGEASGLSLKRGQRGRAEIAVTTLGKAAHSSNPAVGKNAVYMMMQLIEKIRKLPVSHDSFLGDGILELTDIVSASQECYTGAVLSGSRFFPAWVLEETHPLVDGSLAALRQTGLDPALTKYSFCTNGSTSAGVHHIPTIGFGPGREDGAHVVDENIEVEQLIGAAIGYQAIAAKFLLK